MNDHIDSQHLDFRANGAFSANATFRVSFPETIGNAPTNQGVAKYDKIPGNVAENNNQFLALDPGSVSETMEVIKPLNLINRSVATSRVAQSLGLDCVAQEACWMDPDGNRMNVSAFVEGQSLLEVVNTDQDKFTINRSFDLKNPVTQKGLYDLEALDYVMGQVDRHGGNIAISPASGKVAAFDNDLCLGLQPIEESLRDTEIAQKAVGRPPLFYHDQTARQFEQMSSEKLRTLLSSVEYGHEGSQLDPVEIDNAVVRLENLKASIQEARSQGRVVPRFHEGTYETSLALQQQQAQTRDMRRECVTSYLGRSAEMLETAQKINQRQADNNQEITERIDPPRQPGMLSRAGQEVQAAQQALAETKDLVLSNHGRDIEKALKGVKEAQKDLDACRQDAAKALGKLPVAERDRMASELTDAKIAAKALQFGQDNTMRPAQAAAVERMTGLKMNGENLLCKPGQAEGLGQPASGQEIGELRRTLQQRAADLQQQIGQIDQDIAQSLRKPLKNMETAAARLNHAQQKLDLAVSQDPRMERAQQNLQAAQKAPLWSSAENTWQARRDQSQQQAGEERHFQIGARPPQGMPQPAPKVAEANIQWQERKQAGENSNNNRRQIMGSRPSPAVPPPLQAEIPPGGSNIIQNDGDAPSLSRADRLKAFENASSSSSDLSAEKPKAEQANLAQESPKEKTGAVNRLKEQYEQKIKEQKTASQSLPTNKL